MNKILQEHSDAANHEKQMFHLRLVLNILTAYNMLVICITYDGSAIANVMSGLTAICIIAAQFVHNLKGIIVLESSIALIATIIMIQCSYVIIIAIIEVHTRRLRKDN